MKAMLMGDIAGNQTAMRVPFPGERDGLREWAALNRAILHNPDQGQVLQLIVNQTASCTGADACALLLKDGQEWGRVAAFRGLDSGRVDAFRAPLDERLGAAMAGFFDIESGSLPHVVPVLDREGLQGMLWVCRRGSETFSPDEEFLLSALADQAALALGRTRRAEAGDIAERKQAEQEIARLNQDLQRRVADLQTILDTVPIGLAISDDPTGRHIRGNPASERMLGLPPGSELSKGAPEPVPFRVFQDGRELAVEALPVQRAVRGETVVGQVIEVEKSDGQRIVLYCNAAPLRDEGGRPRGAVGAFLDITRIKQTEAALKHNKARFRLLSETAGKLLASNDPQNLVNELCREVMDYLDCQVFFNYLVDEATGRLHLNACAGLSEEEAGRIAWLDYGVAVCGAVARDGRYIIAEDIGHTPDPRTERVRSYGVHAYCCHPLLAGDRLLGTLSFGTRTRARFTPDEIEVMRTVADQVAIAMQRLLVKRRLRESELFYRQTLESIPGMVFTTRPDGYCDYHSQQWVDYTGIPMSEHLGDGWNRLLHPDDRGRAFAAWQAAVAGRAPYDLEYRVRRHDGAYEWFKVRGRPIYNEAGQVVRWFGVAMNIEGLKRSEEALRTSEVRYRSLVEQAVDGIFVTDSRGRYLDVNTAGASMLGYTREELLRLGIPDVLLPEEADRMAQEVAKLREGGVTLSEWRFRRKDGSVFPGEVMCRQLPDGRLQAILRDITERKEAEKARELTERRFKMEESFRLYVATQTAAAIAHELNQPLTAIASYAEVALFLLRTDNPDPKKLKYALENTEKQAQRAGQVTRQLLALLHKGETLTEPVNLKTTLEDALGIVRANGELGGFTVILEIADGLPEVQANRLQIEKVLINLLRNGLEAMRDKRLRSGAINVAARRLEGEPMAHVAVRDCGKGLDERALKSIFQPFYTTKPKGLGMGLAVSRALIEAHGGKLWAEPNAGPGATFHFTLPFAP
jgi:PAS domain S-box-containing protein